MLEWQSGEKCFAARFLSSIATSKLCTVTLVITGHHPSSQPLAQGICDILRSVFRLWSLHSHTQNNIVGFRVHPEALSRYWSCEDDDDDDDDDDDGDDDGDGHGHGHGHGDGDDDDGGDGDDDDGDDLDLDNGDVIWEKVNASLPDIPKSKLCGQYSWICLKDRIES